jgi:BlaI family transcriptional regulator, penicillinase repressor
MEQAAITRAELEVLQVLWREPPLTVGQVIERVRAGADWHDNTIKTLLTRLVEKGAVRRHKDGGRYFYSAAIERDAVVDSEAKGLLDRFFSGRLAPLVAHFAERKKLSARDLKEIEKILSALRK